MVPGFGSGVAFFNAGVYASAGTITYNAGTHNFIVPKFRNSITFELWGAGASGVGVTRYQTYDAKAGGETIVSKIGMRAGPGLSDKGAEVGVATGGTTNINGNSATGTTGAGAPNGGGNVGLGSNGSVPGGGGGGGRATWSVGSNGGTGSRTGDGGVSGAYCSKTFTLGDLGAYGVLHGNIVVCVVGAGGPSPLLNDAGKGGDGRLKITWT